LPAVVGFLIPFALVNLAAVVVSVPKSAALWNLLSTMIGFAVGPAVDQWIVSRRVDVRTTVWRVSSSLPSWSLALLLTGATYAISNGALVSLWAGAFLGLLLAALLFYSHVSWCLIPLLVTQEQWHGLQAFRESSRRMRGYRSTFLLTTVVLLLLFLYPTTQLAAGSTLTSDTAASWLFTMGEVATRSVLQLWLAVLPGLLYAKQAARARPPGQPQ
jgi:hypothetical protein